MEEAKEEKVDSAGVGYGCLNRLFEIPTSVFPFPTLLCSERLFRQTTSVYGVVTAWPKMSVLSPRLMGIHIHTFSEFAVPYSFHPTFLSCRCSPPTVSTSGPTIPSSQEQNTLCFSSTFPLSPLLSLHHLYCLALAGSTLHPHTPRLQL